MRAVRDLIVSANAEYVNDLDLGHTRFTINTSIETVSAINRTVELKLCPKGLIIKPGDFLIIHHNILRRANGIHGTELPSENWLYDDLFYLSPEFVYAYIRNGELKALDPYCFVAPIDYKNDSLFQFSHEDAAYKGKEKNKGILVYGNPSLEAEGILPGDTVYFSEYSEHEYVINGQLLYRMTTKDIILVE